MNVEVPRTYAQDIGFGKIDWHPNSKDSLSFDLNAMHWKSPFGIQTAVVSTSGAILGNNGNSTVEDRYGKGSWTRVLNDHAVNEFRFGWFKDRLSDPGASELWPSTGATYITVNSATVGAKPQAYPLHLPQRKPLMPGGG